MHTIISSRSLLVAVAACAALAANCGLDKQTAPSLAGPSEFGISVTLRAEPDVVVRDGESQSTIVITAHDAVGARLPNHDVRLGLSPSNGGSLSAAQVRTGSNGEVRVVFTSPGVNEPVDAVNVIATGVGSNFDNAAARNVAIALVGPSSAAPSFSVSPVSPQRFQVATFDGSGTMLDGQSCGTACTYAWDFGGEATAAGMTTSYRFRQQQSYVVTLEVVSPGGVTTRTRQTVVVQAGVAPTPTFSVSPTPVVVGSQVFLNASASTAANGATIAEYLWDFGNGTTGTGQTTSTTFGAAGSYIVRLTVRDSNGITATTTVSVTVSAPAP